MNEHHLSLHSKVYMKWVYFWDFANFIEVLVHSSKRKLIFILGRPGKYATVENDELRLPLQNGWKREINVREYSKSGIRGDVVYFAPCGKKFKQYPDIIRVSVSIQLKTFLASSNARKLAYPNSTFFEKNARRSLMLFFRHLPTWKA